MFTEKEKAVLNAIINYEELILAKEPARTFVHFSSTTTATISELVGFDATAVIATLWECKKVLSRNSYMNCGYYWKLRGTKEEIEERVMRYL